MECQEIEPLLAGYALGVLDPKDQHAVESHLEKECASCQVALADYQAVSDGLAFALSPKEPPAHLRARLIAKIAPQPAKPGLMERLRTWSPGIFQTITIAAMLLLVVFNFNLVRNTEQILNDQQTLREQNQAYQTAFALMTYPESQVAVLEKGNVYGTLIYEPHGETAVLSVEGLAKLPRGQAYQLWLIKPDQTRLSGGVFDVVASDEYTSFVIHSPEALDSFIGMGVTIEPTGGSPGPTGPNVFGVEL